MAKQALGFQSLASVRLENNLPRPTSGTGSQVMTIGRNEVEIKWEGGKVVDLISQSKPAMRLTAMADAGSPPEMQDAVQCYKCWVDTDSGAWICLPTTC